MSLVRFSNQFPSLFDRFFDSDMFDWSNRHYSNTNTTLPSVNIKEDNDAYHVEMAVPGFEKKDFKIELNNDLLTISSEKRDEKEAKEGDNYSKREFSYQSFCRSFTLPATVENEKIKAKYDKGILHIDIPKREEAKPLPPKVIAIS